MAPEDENEMQEKTTPGVLRRWMKRFFVLLVVLVTTWIVGVNVWLATGGEATLSRRPDKLQVHYQRAWSILPGRVHVRGLRLSAQTWRNQWQLDLGSGTLDISLVQLLDRHFHLRAGRGEQVSFRLRRRGTPDEPTSAEQLASEGLPDLVDFQWTSALAERPPPRPHRWRITLEEVDLEDVRQIWFDRLRADVAPGAATSARGGLDVVMRGELSLESVRLRLEKARLLVGDEELARDLELETDLTLAPTASRRLREPETFEGLSGTLAVDAEVEGLEFLQSLLPKEQRFDLDAAGRLELRLGLNGGRLTTDSTLLVEADRLGADVGTVSGVGRGTVSGSVVDQQDQSLLRLRALIEDVEVAAGRGDLARAERLELELEGREPRLGAGLQDPRILLVLPALRVPDLRAFSNFVPQGLGLSIRGGSGIARSRIELSGTDERADFDLQADDARLEFRGTPIAGDLRLSGRTQGNPASGRISLKDVEASFRGRTGRGNGAHEEVSFDLQLADTELAVPREGEGLERVQGMRLAGDQIEITGTLDDLGWWETPLRGAEWLRLRGSAELRAELSLRGSGSSTRLTAPSSLRLDVPRLRATLGRWEAEASGRVLGELATRGPRASRLHVELKGPSLEREGLPTLKLPALSLRASGPSLAAGLALSDVRMELDAEPMTLTDLTVLNSYLPEGRLEWTRGAGSMVGKLRLQGNDLDGDLVLRSSERAEASVLGRAVQASVDLEARVRSSDPQSGRFTFQDSTLRLDDVLFTDLSEHSGDWWAVMEIGAGSAKVEQPLQLDAQVKLRMRDTEPIVHLVGESRRAVRWFSSLLEVQNVVGTARVILDEQGVQFHDLVVTGDGLEIVGRIDLRDQVAALLLVKLHGVHAGFEVIGEWHDVNVLRPRRWFEERTAVWQGSGRSTGRRR